ncbi:hypothetical protein KP509_13G014600 [Ceratopteris richardii]|uniref:TPX2 C-terminal domain-containing protein n=1 Tax=Ceratopteris richardii TaxID=49495 RepID=A0A8T2TH00_CERRI|nr:hypothetical protein KP509_13G014600 [Ceratopteris richardii]
METGVAILGCYEDETFDHHDLSQEHTVFDGGLTESVSFGRFAMDSHSWVKRSSFNHNQYLEELQNFSTAGSVRQKKAYFEAYYKAIAKKKALENALAAQGIDSCHIIAEEDNDIDHKEVEPESIHKVDLHAENSCTSATITNNMDALAEHVISGAHNNSESVDHSPTFNRKGNQGLDAGKEDTISSLEALHDPCENPCESVADGLQESTINQDNGFRNEEMSIDLHMPMHHGLPDSQDKIFKSAPEANYMSNIAMENCVDPSMSEIRKNGSESLHIENAGADIIDITGARDENVSTVEVTDENIIVDNSMGKHEMQIVDKFEMSEISKREANPSVESPVQHAADIKVPVLPKRIQVQSMPSSGKAKGSSNTMLRAPSPSLKLERGATQKNQTPGMVEKHVQTARGNIHGVHDIEKKNSAVTKTHLSSTVSQPFSLATNKRPVVTNPLHEQISPKLQRKANQPIPVTDENTTVKGRLDQQPKANSDPKRVVNSKISRKADVSSVKEQKQVGVRNNGLTHVRKSRPSPAKGNSSTFNFKCHERAEKRKEFNSKMEAKISAKEAERNQAVARTQEEAEEEIKQLRKTLRFKATPMPNFYQETSEQKIEIKKSMIPTTRAKSPRLGQRRAPSPNNLESTLLSKVVGEKSKEPAAKQVSRNSAFTESKPSSTRRIRSTFSPSRKVCEGSNHLVEQRTQNLSLGAFKTLQVESEGVHSDFISSGEILEEPKGYENLNFSEPADVKPNVSEKERQTLVVNESADLKGQVSASQSIGGKIKHNDAKEKSETLVLNKSADMKDHGSGLSTSDERAGDAKREKSACHGGNMEKCKKGVVSGKDMKREASGTPAKIPKRDMTPKRGTRASTISNIATVQKGNTVTHVLKQQEDIDASKSSMGNDHSASGDLSKKG